MKHHIRDTVLASFFGLVIGDALGVPVEFKNRTYLRRNPVTTLLGYGTHNQPKGAWSDDSSLTLCLAESLSNGYNLKDIGDQFIHWLKEGHNTATGEVFDVGNTTARSIARISSGIAPEKAGGDLIRDNGNGSLMRILPLIFYFHVKKLDESEKFQIIKAVSSITHAHLYSILSCYIYIDFGLHLLETHNIAVSYECIKLDKDKYHKYLVDHEFRAFDKIFYEDLSTVHESKIQSDGYVLHTLEASLWCLLTTSSYKECVLKAVNLGEDTDTVAAIAGGLAGLHYGFEDIPPEWIQSILKRNEILKLVEKFYDSLY